MIFYIYLIWTHFFMDFLMQTDDMARGKSKSMKWLSAHVAVYACPFFLLGWKFGVITFCTHWLTDFVTSRISAKLWEEKRVHDFFVCIGADQAIHATTLILTARLLGYL